jgi:hypothetical protein
MAEESKQISFRLVQTFYRELEARAKKAKTTPPQLARELVINALTEPKVEPGGTDLSVEFLRLEARLDEISELIRTDTHRAKLNQPKSEKEGPTLPEIEALLQDLSKSIGKDINGVRRAIAIATAGLLTKLGKMSAEEVQRWVKEKLLER